MGQKNDNKKIYFEKLRLSAMELRSTSTLTLCALFAALGVVLKMVASIDIGPYVRIGFSQLPAQFVDTLFGPITGALFGMALDVIQYIIAPNGAFFFGFTLSAIVSGFIFGSFYYKQKLTFLRILLANALNALVVGLCLNTTWLVVLYGKSFTAILPARILKEAIMCPINSAIFFFVMTAVEKTGVFNKFRAGAAI